ncbi:MAG: DNA alkylation repair protein [Bdellovibrionaceae bacterium]|nr:DNA alkylation repair protein [Pseudobdellovibrionaceae bacterium]
MPAKQKIKTIAKVENPNAFKYWISEALIKRMGKSIAAVYPQFDQKLFLKCATRLGPLELKDRVRMIREQLHDILPAQYPQALKILLASVRLKSLSGFDLWPYSDFVQTYGLVNVELSLKALREMNMVFSSEFAVRPFILQHPKTTMDFLLANADDSSVDVRRWTSEGTRPRLPWGEKLGPFIADPTPTLPILEKLKFDEELYVRKSVSNHLNDIAKDHPEVVLRLLARWSKEADERHAAKIEWIIHRSLRSLIKAGNPGALKLIGADHGVKLAVKHLSLQKKTFKLNEKIEFNFTVHSLAKKPQKIVIDYIIHHMKSNKETSPKVFKLKTLTLAPGERVDILKKHPLKLITTRKYYPGRHGLEIQINGKVYSAVEWNLKI